MTKQNAALSLSKLQCCSDQYPRNKPHNNFHGLQLGDYVSLKQFESILHVPISEESIPKS